MLLYILLVGILIAYPLGKVSRLLLVLRLKRNKTVIAEYDIPSQLTPAELGYLVDRKFENNELLATIFWLHQKGFIRLVKQKKDNPLVQPTGKKSEREKLSYSEFAVLAWIGEEAGGGIELDQLIGLFNSKVGVKESFDNETFIQLVEKGYLQQYSYFSIMNNRRSSAIKISLLVVVLGALYKMITFSSTSSLNGGFRTINDSVTKLVIVLSAVLLWPVLFVYIRLLQLIYNGSRGLHIKETKLLSSKWPEIAGYQLYLQTVEFSRMNADPNINESVLPYCIALGYKPNIESTINLSK